MLSRKAKMTAADTEAAANLKRLWSARARNLGVTQDTIAEELGITQGAVSQYVTGLIPLNYRALLAFAKHLGIDPGQIRSDLPEQRMQGPAPVATAETDDTVPVPIWSARGSSGDGANNEHATPIGSLLFRANSLRKKRLTPARCRAIYVDGSSMLPRLRDGDAVMYDESDRTPKDGRIYVVRWNGHEYIKRLVMHSGRWWLSSDNKADPQWSNDRPIDPERDDFEVLGRVRWVGSWED